MDFVAALSNAPICIFSGSSEGIFMYGVDEFECNWYIQFSGV